MNELAHEHTDPTKLDHQVPDHCVESLRNYSVLKRSDLSARSFALPILVLVSIILCGCTPLHFRLFLRNTTSTTATIWFRTGAVPDDSVSPDMLLQPVTARSTPAVLNVNNHLLSKLTDSVTATVTDSGYILIVPPHTTIYLNDLLTDDHYFPRSTIIIDHAQKKDTLSLAYPLHKVKGLETKRDAGYNFFYSTLVYYDIE